MRCNNCGSYNDDDRQRCEMCGEALSSSDSAALAEERETGVVREELIKEEPGTQIKKTGILFFYKSPVTVFWLSFLTLGLYNIYWFYKHWRVIRLSTSVQTWPILSSIFQVLTAYPLFTRIKSNASKHAYELKSVGWLAAAYIVAVLVSNAVARTEIRNAAAGSATQEGDIVGFVITITLGIVIALVPATVQRAANVHNVAVLGTGHHFRKIFPGEILFSIIGISLFVLAMYQYGHDIIGNKYPAGTQAEISAEGARVDLLRAEYDTCSTALNTRYDSVDTTDGAEVDAYNSDLQECDNTRLELNESVERYNWLGGYEDQ